MAYHVVRDPELTLEFVQRPAFGEEFENLVATTNPYFACAVFSFAWAVASVTTFG